MPSDNLDSMRLEAFGGVAVVAVADAAALSPAVDAVKRTVAEFDLACSRFRDDSELSAVNRSSGQPVRVGRVLLDAVGASLRAARLTAGDVDPTVGEAMIALGYDRDFDLLSLDTDAASASVLPVAAIPGWRTVAVDTERSTVRVPPRVVLDLGATAKALAADRAAADAFAVAGCGVLVSFSGDIAIAGPAPPAGWRVRVTDDHRAGVEAPGQWISLHSGGLATSSSFVRRWPTSHGVAHHVVDPSTGRSADTLWRTASVTARTCLDANIASIATIVRGAPAPAWLEQLGLPSRLVGVDGTVLHVAGWPSEGDDL
ncbi:MAG TPA: FAD:protein FMN transferase [Solirubrobacteraceae bacterium]|nr:FAD:protein FMN transferase [Solirubrobacteraceae bacterium]